MAELKESPESQRMEASKEYSACSLDSLNLDCLLAIFQHLQLLDLLRLRPQCRSLNDAVCEFLRSCHKLELNLDADRSGEDLERVLDEYNFHHSNYYTMTLEREDEPPEIHSITFSDTVKFHSHLFKNQPHFRCEDMIQVNSTEGLTDRKVDSLIAFLTACMPNLSELALLVSHEDYFRCVNRILTPLRKLKVFLIDANSAMELGYGRANFPSTEIVEAICSLPELESLYYFRNHGCLPIFCYDRGDFDEMDFPPKKVDPHRLRSGENFLEVLLPRLRVLHCHHFAFPVGLTFDKVEEISITHHMMDSVTKNYFPAVKTLFIKDPLDLVSQLGDGRLSFVNVKVLKLENYCSDKQSSFYIDSESMKALNDLPNLEELHCRYVFDTNLRPRDVIEPNNTIVRLYNQHQPKGCYDCKFSDFSLGVTPDPNCINAPKKMAEYVGFCKKYFRKLELFTNENPQIVQRFRPEIDDYDLP